MKKNNLTLRFILLAAIVFISPSLFAQQTYCPPNIDFEQNNFNNWLGNVGYVSSGTIGTVSVLTYPTIPTGINPVQQIVRSAGTDYYGGFPVVNPYSTNKYSLQLGDTLGTAGAVCSQVKYYVTIPQGVNKYSLEYFYAIVMENPNHPIESQPDFRMTVTDTANNSIRQCSSFIITQPVNGGFPGFQLSNPALHYDSVFYLPWTASTLNLDGLAGHTICITFDASDCAYGGHWGYAYVDFSTACASPVLTNGTCLGAPTATVQANTGFSQYQWYDSTLTTLLDTNQTLILNPAPTTATKLYCILTPLNHLGCNDTVPFFLTQGVQSTANFGFVKKTCGGSTIQFYDSTINNNPNGFTNKWKWNFGDVNASGTNPNTDSTQNPQHRFDSIGNYTVCMISNPNQYCLADTICKTVIISQPTPLLSIYSTKDSICGNADSTTIVFTGSIFSNCTYRWVLDSTTRLINGSINSTNSIQVSFSSSGNHTIQIQQIPSSNDTNCIAIGATNVFVKGLTPLFSISGVDSICVNKSTILALSNFSNNISCGAIIQLPNVPTSIYSVGLNNAGNMSFVTPFFGTWTESKCQMLYLATELHNMGLQRGVISEMAWNILVKNSQSPPPNGAGPCTGTDQYHDFTIKIACVPYNSVPTSVDLTTPLTTVYTTPIFNTVLGINNFILQSPYSWDGVSNILVQTCFDAGNSCYSGTDYVASSTNASIATAANAPSGINLAVIAYSDTYQGCDPLYPSTGANIFSAITNRPDIIFKVYNSFVSQSTFFSWSSNPVGVSGSSDSLTVTPTVNTTYTLTGNDNGCSSSASHTITTVTKINVNKYQTTCASHPYFFNGNYLNQSGIYFDTITSGIGCDTLISLHLHVDTNFVYQNLYPTICQGTSYYFNGMNLTTQGIYYDTLHSTTLSCDTLITLNLNVVQTNQYYITDTACSAGFVFFDSTLTQSGTYTFTIHHSQICDSVFVLNLTLLNNLQATISVNNDTLICNNNGYFYQWFDCSTMQPILGENNKTFITAMSGNYAVAIQRDSCYDMSACYNFVASGVNNTPDSKFKIYPNPTNNAIFIEWQKQNRVQEITLTDVLGRVILKNVPSNSSANFSLKNLSAGIYFLRIKGMETEHAFKVVKE